MSAVRSLDAARRDRPRVDWWQVERLVLTADLETLARACTPDGVWDAWKAIPGPTFFRCPMCDRAAPDLPQVLSELDWECPQCGPHSRLDLAHVVLRKPSLRARLLHLRQDDR